MPILYFLRDMQRNVVEEPTNNQLPGKQTFMHTYSNCKFLFLVDLFDIFQEPLRLTDYWLNTGMHAWCLNAKNRSLQLGYICITMEKRKLWKTCRRGGGGWQTTSNILKVVGKQNKKTNTLPIFSMRHAAGCGWKVHKWSRVHGLASSDGLTNGTFISTALEMLFTAYCLPAKQNAYTGKYFQNV